MRNYFRLSAALLSLLLLSACAPSEGEARRAFEGYLGSAFGVPFKVISFRKMDGFQRNFDGRELYEMTVETEVEFDREAHPECKPMPAGVLNTRPQCNRTRYGAAGRNRFSGSLTFIRSERGWSLNSVGL